MDSKELSENESKENNEAKPAIVLKFIRNRYLKPFGCTVCPCSYTQFANLKYHIRREHYNMIAKINKREKRNIDDVWLERVINSDDVVEIRKAGHNKYLIKKCSNPDRLQIAESKDTLDLSPLYPDCRKVNMKQIPCCICKKNFMKSDYKRHLQKDHADLVV